MQIIKIINSNAYSEKIIFIEKLLVSSNFEITFYAHKLNFLNHNPRNFVINFVL